MYKLNNNNLKDNVDLFSGYNMNMLVDSKYSDKIFYFVFVHLMLLEHVSTPFVCKKCFWQLNCTYAELNCLK